jgi:hypothetical protein
MLTRSTLKLFLWTLPLLLSTLACRTATSLLPDTTSPSVSAPTLIPETATLPATSEAVQEASCPSALNAIMTAASMLGGSEKPQSESALVTYTVTGEQLSNPMLETVPVGLKTQQDDVATQQQIWNYFAALIPEEQRGMISYYSVLTDGKNNLLAAVAQTYHDPSQWVLEVDIADASDTANLTFTMIHEFGHLLTLNSNQVPPSMEVFDHPHDITVLQQQVAMCPNYFTGEGCSNGDSYINHYYQRFWSDIYDEWSQINQIKDERDYYEKMSRFYFNYEDRFVSEYATSNPAEDLAESWTYFVLGPKPSGNTIADQKVLFFYEHPELVVLRAQILNRLCTIFPQ